MSGMRRLVAVISAIVFLDAMLFGALIPLVPAYVDDFDLTKLQAGMLVGAFGAGAILGGIPGGIVAGRVGSEERRHQRTAAARARDLRTGARRLAGNGRHRPVPSGPLERIDVGWSALLGHRVDAARAPRPAPRHGLRDRRPRRDSGADGRSRRQARRVPGRLRRHRRDRLAPCRGGAPPAAPRGRGRRARRRAPRVRRPGVRRRPLAQCVAGTVLRRARRARSARTRRGRLRRRRDRSRLPRRRADRDGAEPAARAALRPPGTALADPLGAQRVDRRRDPARLRRQPACDRLARDRGRGVVRRLLHAWDRPRVGPRRDRRARAGARVRRHEHRLGGRCAGGADARRWARRPRSGMPRPTSSARLSARARSRRSACAYDHSRRRPDRSRQFGRCAGNCSSAQAASSGRRR